MSRSILQSDRSLTNKSDESRVKLGEAIDALVARSDAIAALAMESGKTLSSAFSKKENVYTTDLSIAFMEAVAATASIDDIRALAPKIECLRDHVLASNEVVADRSGRIET